MKLLIAISIIFAVYVSSQDGNEEIANKVGHDLILKVYNLLVDEDRVGLEAIYDNWFMFNLCGDYYYKEDIIEIGLNKTEFNATMNSTVEFNVTTRSIYEFNVTQGVMTDTKLTFLLTSRLLDGLEDIDYVDYVWRRPSVNDEWVMWRMNFSRCDLFEAHEEEYQNDTLNTF